MRLIKEKITFSFRDSNFLRLLLFFGGGLALVSIFICAVWITNKFIFEQPYSEIFNVEYYLILGIISLIFMGIFVVIIRPFVNKAFRNFLPNNSAKSDVHTEICEEDLAFQQKSIAALLSISESRGNLLPLDQVFHHALRVVQEVTGFNTVVIRLYDEKAQCLRLAAQQGMSSSMQKELAVVPINDRFEGKALRSFWPVPIEDLAAEDASWVGASPARSGFHSVVCVPLVSGEVPIGTMELGSKRTYQATEDELRWFALVGRAIGSIVHRVRLTEHLRDFAALQERSRLAQELHDGLVQLIGSINMWSQEAQDAFTEEDYLATQKALNRIKTISRDAYASLREELLGLRDAFDSDRDLLSVIREYLSRFQRQWRIETQIVVDESKDLKISQLISPSAEVQLLRIIQEALTNVRRHAEATHVIVSIYTDDKRLRINIEDNGQGFMVGDVKGGHLGLNIMRERVASVEGMINITSEPGVGTKIAIGIPLQKTGIVHRRVR